MKSLQKFSLDQEKLTPSCLIGWGTITKHVERRLLSPYWPFIITCLCSKATPRRFKASQCKLICSNPILFSIPKLLKTFSFHISTCMIVIWLDKSHSSKLLSLLKTTFSHSCIIIFISAKFYVCNVRGS